jgi:putative ABC transport system substrate-binding protein
MRRRDFITLLGGAAAGWPLAVRAQQPMPLVGFLSLGNPPNSLAFRQGLAEAGFVEGKNVRFEFRSASNNGRLPAAAVELINDRPAVIVATGSPVAVLAAKAATSTVPIVFATNLDPLKYGFVTSLSRPGGNMTGISLLSSELVGKRLNLLLELAPQATKFAYLSGPAGAPIFEDLRSRTVAAGRALGREIVVLEIRRDLDLEPAFATLVEQGAGALIVGDFTSLGSVSDRIIALAARHKVPTMYPSRFYAAAGGLMSYSADLVDINRQLGAQYVGRILKGAKPSDLPVQQPTKFKLVINLNTAKVIGLEVPPQLLAISDEVIEYEPPLGWNLGWRLMPTITVVAAADDPRLPLVGDAVAFWNDRFAELGTQFKLGALTQVAGPMPAEDLEMLSNFAEAGRRLPELPESLKRIEGNIVVALSEGQFISFTTRWAALDKAVVVIKDYRSFPLTLPNVARNLIAHLLGLAIGLSHNADPTTLMCGRPASCRPDIFASDRPKYFTLTEGDEADLQQMYPKSWQASR